MGSLPLENNGLEFHMSTLKIPYACFSYNAVTGELSARRMGRDICRMIKLGLDDIIDRNSLIVSYRFVQRLSIRVLVANELHNIDIYRSKYSDSEWILNVFNIGDNNIFKKSMKMDKGYYQDRLMIVANKIHDILLNSCKVGSVRWYFQKEGGTSDAFESPELLPW
jgi:hypothetical protein